MLPPCPLTQLSGWGTQSGGPQVSEASGPPAGVGGTFTGSKPRPGKGSAGKCEPRGRGVGTRSPDRPRGRRATPARPGPAPPPAGRRPARLAARRPAPVSLRPAQLGPAPLAVRRPPPPPPQLGSARLAALLVAPPRPSAASRRSARSARRERVRRARPERPRHRSRSRSSRRRRRPAPPAPGPMPAELRQVGRNLVPGGGSVSGTGGGGRGAGPPGGPAFVCGAAGRRQLLSAPPGPGPGVGAEWTHRRGCGERAGVGAMEAGGRGRTPASDPDRCLGQGGGQGLPEWHLCCRREAACGEGGAARPPPRSQGPGSGAARELRDSNGSHSAEAAHVDRGLGACPAHVQRRRGCPPSTTSTGEGWWVACTLAQSVCVGGVVHLQARKLRQRGGARGGSGHLPSWTARCLLAPETEGPVQGS